MYGSYAMVHFCVFNVSFVHLPVKQVYQKNFIGNIDLDENDLNVSKKH